MREYIHNVKGLLRLYGIKQKQFAIELSVSKSTVSEWASGKKDPPIWRYGPILDAVQKLGNPEALKLKPITGIHDLIVEKNHAPNPCPRSHGHRLPTSAACDRAARGLGGAGWAY